MKYIFIAVLLAFSGYVAWPYFHLYRIDHALSESDRGKLERLVDLAAVRAEFKHRLERDMDSALGSDDTGVLGWLKDKVGTLGKGAVDETIDLAWVSRTLTARGSFSSSVTHAFFESWDEFVVRLGDLGDNPVHLRLRLNWLSWQVTEIYD